MGIWTELVGDGGGSVKPGQLATSFLTFFGALTFAQQRWYGLAGGGISIPLQIGIGKARLLSVDYYVVAPNTITGTNIVMTILKNGVATAQTATFTPGTGAGHDGHQIITATVDFADGDYMDVTAVNAGGGGTPVNLGATLRFGPLSP